MIIIIGASASGKTELAKILVGNYDYKKLVTTTTRQIRDKEVNHVDYHFISKDEFLLAITNNEFVEHACYNNNYYGINKKHIVKNALVILEPKGANEIIKLLNKKAFIVYVETIQSIREERMILRGDSEKSIIERLQNDEEIFKISNLSKVDLIINNNDHNLNELALLIHNDYEKYKKTEHIE